MSHHLELDDVLFEVRRALRLGRDQVELRKRMACPACAAAGEAFDPGPVVLVVPVSWPRSADRKTRVTAGLDQCLEAARTQGLTIEGADERARDPS